MAGFNSSQARVPPGQAGGGEWGQPRDAAAAKAQQSKTAEQLYNRLLAMPPAQRAAYVKTLSTPQLEALSRIVYSSRTSNPNVVNGRLVVAHEMGVRGKDVKKYGAVGGGLPPSAKTAMKKAAANKVAAAKSKPTASSKSGAPKASPGQKSAAARDKKVATLDKREHAIDTREGKIQQSLGKRIAAIAQQQQKVQSSTSKTKAQQLAALAGRAAAARATAAKQLTAAGAAEKAVHAQLRALGAK